MFIKSNGNGIGTKFFDDEGNELNDLHITSLKIEIPGPRDPAKATFTAIAPKIDVQVTNENIKIKHVPLLMNHDPKAKVDVDIEKKVKAMFAKKLAENIDKELDKLFNISSSTIQPCGITKTTKSFWGRIINHYS